MNPQERDELLSAIQDALFDYDAQPASRTIIFAEKILAEIERRMELSSHGGGKVETTTDPKIVGLCGACHEALYALRFHACTPSAVKSHPVPTAQGEQTANDRLLARVEALNASYMSLGKALDVLHNDGCEDRSRIVALESQVADHLRGITEKVEGTGGVQENQERRVEVTDVASSTDPASHPDAGRETKETNDA